MFVTYDCNRCSAVPITQYRKNKIFQEIMKEKDCFKSSSDEKLYIDMRRSKGYTDELEKLTHGDSDVSLTVNSKLQQQKG